MKKFRFYTFCFLLLCGVANAQDEIRSIDNYLSFKIGYQGNYLKDFVLSPLHYRGAGMQYGFSYRRISENIFGISVNYGVGEVRSSETSGFTNTFLDLGVGVEYLFQIKNNNESLNYYLGGAYETNAFFIEWNNLDAFSYTSTQGLEFKGLVTKKINERHSIQTSFALPIVQILGRPPYNGINEFIIENQDYPVKIMLQGEPASFGQYSGLVWDMAYTYQISPRLRCNLAYSIFLQKINNLHAYKRLAITPETGITVKL